MISKIIIFLKLLYYRSSSKRFCRYLRKKGVKIGEGTSFRQKTAHIDLTRPSLISIGKDCFMNENFTILTHDFVTRIFRNIGLEFLPSSGRVTIGNNVAFGQNVTILKGVTIGDNCFIGYGSIVTKDIPDNSIAVGAPCRTICTVDEYYQKRVKQCIPEALDYARSIKEKFGRLPITTDFHEEFPLFVDGNKIYRYPELKGIIKRQCGPTYDAYVASHKAVFPDFNAFLSAAGITQQEL